MACEHCMSSAAPFEHTPCFSEEKEGSGDRELTQVVLSPIRTHRVDFAVCMVAELCG